MNIVLLEPKNRHNLATVIRSGQNFGVKSVFVIGGFVRDQYKGNIHKFSHQMNTQDGISALTLVYVNSLSEFLRILPAQTTLVVVETISDAQDLRRFEHPLNATYLFGREAVGIKKSEVLEIREHFAALHAEIPTLHLAGHKKTAHLNFVKIDLPQSLNVGVCASIVMYDRHCKHAQVSHS